MNELKINQTRSQPLMLVLVLLAVVGLSTILVIAINFLSARLFLPRQFAFIQLILIPFLSFPFSLTCVVWLASRSGRTGRSTWIVPLVLIAAAAMIGIIGIVLSFRMRFPFRTGDLISSFRSEWICYVILAFLFQMSSLHLRPVEAESSPRRLTVYSMLVLTAIVAIGLGIDATMFRQPIGQAPRGLGFLSPTYVFMTFYYAFAMAVVWFSTAWLFVSNNPKRWLGVVGLLAYAILRGIQFFAIMPEIIRQMNQAGGPAMPTMQSQFLWQFVISVFQIAIVFSCVGMMHVAGYRWDILRRLPREREKTGEAVDGLPPIIHTATGCRYPIV